MIQNNTYEWHVSKGLKKITFSVKDLLSKEHHCYKIHTLKSSGCPSSIENALYGLPSILTRKSWSPFNDFSKSQPPPPYKCGGCLHYAAHLCFFFFSFLPTDDWDSHFWEKCTLKDICLLGVEVVAGWGSFGSYSA